MHGPEAGDVSICIEGLGKEYRIGAAQEMHDHLGDQLVDMLFSPFRRAGKLLRGQATGAAELDETVWALRDVSFQVGHGEVLGVIGPNGAGKSTLLKILSRITEPTEGWAEIRGRVGSLLEVGTGFHPELTGRENIHLNGAILGMGRREIEAKFEQIIAFAEIGKYIDTPLKHYSSGMYMRLAFSVAAHLEPDILLIDEVLAVGDASFQKKCLGKMDDVAHEGRTVLFVSHNLGLIQSLCDRGVCLDGGRVQYFGAVSDVVDAYLRTIEQTECIDLAQRTDRRGEGRSLLTAVDVLGCDGVGAVRTGGPASFAVQISEALPQMGCSLSIFDHLGQPVVIFAEKFDRQATRFLQHQGGRFVCEVEELLLVPGRYRIDVWLSGDNRVQDSVTAARFFDVHEGDLRGRMIQAHKRFRLVMPHSWHVKKE